MREHLSRSLKKDESFLGYRRNKNHFRSKKESS